MGSQAKRIIEGVIAKWSQRGYIEEEMTGTIAFDLYEELVPLLATIEGPTG